MKVKYTTYIDVTGALWTFDHVKETLIDPYLKRSKILRGKAQILALVEKSILKKVWSTDKNGKYI